MNSQNACNMFANRPMHLAIQRMTLAARTCRPTQLLAIMLAVCLVLPVLFQTQSVAQDVSSTSSASAVVKKGDRVAWLGGQIWELMQDQADLETVLAIRLAGQQIVFRNCGWSGDDVSGRARAVFGSVEDGYQRRLVDLKNAKPTVVFVSYGQNEALDRSWTSEKFTQGLQRLVQDLKSAGYRLVLLSPAEIPNGTRFPKGRLSEANKRIQEFGAIVKNLAQQEGCHWLELPGLSATESVDGLRPHPNGYQSLAMKWSDSLLPVFSDPQKPAAPLPKTIALSATKEASVQSGEWNLSPLSVEKDTLRWKEQFSSLPVENLRVLDQLGREQPEKRSVQIAGLAPGKYKLTVAGDEVAQATADEWAKGLPIAGFGADLQRQKLQRALIDKEAMFMHRYRPQNETYLFLFRKHEQGNNAPEIDQFEELLNKQDQSIQGLASPQTYTWELSRVQE
jgi:lysophospholipase L1-like esterase